MCRAVMAEFRRALLYLNAPFDDVKYNQPDNIGYCLGVKSEQITFENAGKTALEFEYYTQKPQCVGIKFIPVTGLFMFTINATGRF